MKQVIFSLICVLAGLAIVVLSALSTGNKGFAHNGVEHATEAEAVTHQASESAQLTTEFEPQVNYYLPYPGILPDHFLYPIKMLRDRAKLMFVTDKTEKAEMLLLFADKRIGAAQVLVTGGKASLGSSVAMKAEGYLERAQIESMDLDKIQLKDKLYQSTLKHKQILEELKALVDGNELRNIEASLDTNARVVEVLRPKN